MDYEFVSIKEEDNLLVNFKAQLEKHNQKALNQHGRKHFTDKEFDRICIHLEGGTRFEKAKKLRDLFPLELENGERIWVEFLNKNKWCQNEFQVFNQITVEGRNKCRYDVTILINGLPLVQIELKKRGLELKEAFNQVQRYQKTSYQGLFDYIQLFVISNGVNTRYFSNNPNSGYKFTFNWTDAENVPFNDLAMFARFFFDKCNLGKLISKYVVLHEEDKSLMVLRPYQFYAVERILDKVQNSNKNGYIWHTTGAGKTLTSFKAAQLVSEVDDVDKVLFIVDRKDLDTQTKAEYEAFEPGAVDGTDNTRELIKRLSGDSKIIITTIQKLNNAVTKDRHNKHLQDVRNQKIVMIFDECHRSQFGESHKNIVHFFNNLQLFGFTGTPIFVENANRDITTKEVFGDCLHRYLIKDAIADENVLGFLVEYYIGKNEQDVNYMKETRMREIAQFILSNFNKSTYDGDFNAMFAVSSVPMLLQYYKIFKELKPKIKIGAVFTYIANSNQDDEQTGMDQGFVNENVTSDELQLIMNDYNEMFGTDFTTDQFALYYDDINLRMKKKKKDMEPLDLVLVVGMFLTGFDAKKLNTLYVDKNLEYHGLVQAFSRTNRVLNEKKKFGKIVCFRNLKNNVDEAIKLFSNNEPNEYIIRAPFADVKEEFNTLIVRFKEKYPDISYIDNLKSEYDKRDFVLAFREIIRKRAEIQVYEDFDADDSEIQMSEQEFMDFRSKYLDIALGNVKEETELSDIFEPYGDDRTLEDIDFCLELLHSDVINVAYILALIADLNPSSEDYHEKRRQIIDTMEGDSAMRNKAKLIDDFIRQNIDNDKENFEKSKTDGSIDMESRLEKFISGKRNESVRLLAERENIDPEALCNFLEQYDYSKREKSDIIKEAIKHKKIGFIERRNILKRVTEQLRNIIEVFNWE